MKDTDYAFAVAYIRTLENKMLKKADYDALLGAGSRAEALRLLKEKGYGGIPGARRDEPSEDILKAEMRRAWSEVATVCPPGAPVDIILYQNDFHNLKAILKAAFSGERFEHLMQEPNTVPPEAIRDAIAVGKPENLPEPLGKGALEAFRALAGSGDGQLAEILLDKAMFEAMDGLAERSGSEFLAGWVDLNKAIANMRIALRGAYGGRSMEFLRGAMPECKRINTDHLAEAASRDAAAVMQFFAQGGESGAADAARESLSAFDKYCDNALIDYLKAARYRAFGFEPILGYVVCKQYELQAARIILSGLENGTAAEAVRERLRDVYA